MAASHTAASNPAASDPSAAGTAAESAAPTAAAQSCAAAANDGSIACTSTAAGCCHHLAQIEQLNATIEALRRLSAIDHLTGVANRAVIEETGERELQRLARYGHPVSLVFCDIDHFKLVNDGHGHAVGDAVLRQFAARLQQVARGVDVVGRQGGEEFVVLLPNTGVSGARVIAEKLRAAVADPPFAAAGRITASFGVAQAEPGEDRGAWFARADAAMYDAKQRGRNQVAVAWPADPRAAEESVAGGFMQLVWRDIYRCGQPLIDAQHEGLFAVANEMLNAAAGATPAQLLPLLSLLIDDCRRHFLDEERILRDAGWHGLQQHAALHVALLQQAESLRARCATGSVDVGALLTFIARDLVAGHMLREDRRHQSLYAS